MERWGGQPLVARSTKNRKALRSLSALSVQIPASLGLNMPSGTRSRTGLDADGLG
jgi:hypothetical protein